MSFAYSSFESVNIKIRIQRIKGKRRKKYVGHFLLTHKKIHIKLFLHISMQKNTYSAAFYAVYYIGFSNAKKNTFLKCFFFCNYLKLLLI